MERFRRKNKEMEIYSKKLKEKKMNKLKPENVLLTKMNLKYVIRMLHSVFVY